MKQPVLVTGAAGFIGSHLSERLVSAGHPVIGLDNFDDFTPPALKKKNLSNLRGEGNFQLVEGDIRDSELLKELFRKQDFKAVFHLAARAGVRASLEQPVLYQDINVRGTLNLLEACRTSRIEKFIYTSSSSVYGNNSASPFREDTNVNSPISPYAASKAAAELFCRAYHNLYKLPVVILRLFTVYGPRQRPDLAIHRFTRQILNGQEVTILGDGNSIRDYTYVEDVVDGYLAALRYQGDGFHIFNIGGGHPVGILALIQSIERSLHKSAFIRYTEPVPGDMKTTVADISKANSRLGYQPRIGIEEGISRFVKWYLANEESER